MDYRERERGRERERERERDGSAVMPQRANDAYIHTHTSKQQYLHVKVCLV